MEYCNNKEIFIKHGIKNTKQRNTVLEILRDEAQPLTAEQIFLKSKACDGAINLSTVYRILDMFETKEIIVKTSISKNNRALFELNRMEHKHHLVCVTCKKVTALDSCPFEHFGKNLEQQTDFQITSHKLEIYGYCSNCKDKDLKPERE